MKKLMLPAIVMLLLAAPAQGKAKELLGAQLCGPGGCATERTTTLLEGPGGPFGGGEIGKPAKPGPYYKGYLLAGDGGKVMGKLPFYYVPGANQIVQPGRYGQTTTWMAASGRIGKLVSALAERVDPFAAPKVRSVTLNGKAVDDPQSYVALWTMGEKVQGYPSDDLDSQQVIFFTDPPTPWSDGNYVVAYPKSKMLLRDGQLVSISKGTASRIAAGASLDAPSGQPWLWVLIGIACAACASAAGLAVRRLRVRSGPKPVPQAST